MLHGRLVEQARLERLLEDARASRSGVLVLRGEAGIGKSALLEHAVSIARGMRVLRAVGLEGESELAFAGLHALLRPVLDRIDGLPAPQAAALRGAFGLVAEGVDDRFLVSVAVLTLLSEVGGNDGLLCVLDDAQWLDEPSMDALLFAARRLDADPVVLLIGARTGDAHELPPTGLPELRLGPLDADAARLLLKARAPEGLAGAVADEVLAGTHGNPLALIEVPAALSADQQAGREALPSPLPAGRRVEQAFLARARGLDERTQGLLLLAAADDTGDVGTVRAAGDLFGLGATECDTAEQAGLISIAQGRLRFRHPLVRSAVYGAATHSSRRAVHRALAAALEGQADRRAWHLAAAAWGPDEAAAEALERSAGDAARRSGHAAAAAALERAAELSDADTARARRLLAAAEASRLAGRRDRSIKLIERAEPSASTPEQRLAIAYLRGSHALESGAPQDAYELLVAGASQAVERDPASGLELLVRAAFAGRVEWAPELRRLAAAAPAPASDRERLMAAVVIGTSAILMGDLEAAGPPLADACALAGEVTGPRLVMTAGAAAAHRGDVELAEVLFTRATTQARSTGTIGALPIALNGLGIMQSLVGRLAAAATSAAEGLELARQTGQDNIACYHLALAARVAALQGRDDDSRDLAGEALTIAREHGLRMQASMATWALAELDLGRGDAGQAFARLERIDSDPGIAHPGVRLYVLPYVVEAATRTGDPTAVAAARVALGRFAAWADTCGSAWAHPQVARLEALLAPAAGVEAHFEEALARHALGGGALERARTQLLYGEWLRRQRRRVDARSQLRPALETLDAMGASLWADRARAELRATGETARKREPSTIDELTPQERQIAQLVAEGATNRAVAAQLFLSPRTIDYHLRNVFRKLDVTSRHQLAPALAMTPASPPPRTATGSR